MRPTDKYLRKRGLKAQIAGDKFSHDPVAVATCQFNRFDPDEENDLDQCRISVVELVHELSVLFNASRMSGFNGKHDTGLKKLIEKIRRLSKDFHLEDSILIQHMGRKISKDCSSSGRNDYTIMAGRLSVDGQAVKLLAKRQGVNDSDLHGRLNKAFDCFYSLGINSLCLHIDPKQSHLPDRLWESLQYLAWYYYASQYQYSIDKSKMGAAHDNQIVIYNEFNRPDPNLTMLAGINRLTGDTAQLMVRRVYEMMQQPGKKKQMSKYDTVYSAIFAIKQFREQLLKPAVEVNSSQWQLVAKNESVFPKGAAQPSKVVAKICSASPEMAALINHSLFQEDPRDWQVTDLQISLKNFSSLLERFGQYGNPEGEDEVARHSFRNLMSLVPDELLNQITVGADGLLRVETGQGEATSLHLQPEVVAMVSFFKRRQQARGKMRQMLHAKVTFTAHDLETIADDFDITTDDAESLLKLLRDCFNEKGRFNRNLFESNIPAFIAHELKVFDFLWHYVKEMPSREDRVAFLNSLQLLISQMNDPSIALRILLRDFTAKTEEISFYDRNCLILSNILLRKYNQELLNHVETTPEEVLLVREGLSPHMLTVAEEIIDQNLERLFQKIRTLHALIRESLQPKTTGKEIPPIKYLSSVERELYILLSLVGCPAAHVIMRSVVKVYGAPDSLIYGFAATNGYVKNVLKMLQLAVRGLGRFGQKGDLPLLKDVLAREQEFMALDPALADGGWLKRVLYYVEQAILSIAPAQSA